MDIILLNSGGIDSLASAIIAKQYNHTLYSLHLKFNYPNADKALIAAEKLANEYCVEHKVINVSDLNPIGITTTSRFRPAPYQHTIACILGASHAQQKGFARVMTGIRKAEIIREIDTYNESLSFALSLYNVPTHTDLHFMFPLKDIPLTMDDTFYNIIKDSPVLHDTVSCLNDPPCGECFKCQFRAKYQIGG